MPFLVPWTARPPAEVARSVVQRHCQQLGEWSPEKWSLDLAVFRDGVPVGRQNIRARDLAVTREVSTGSWVGKRHHGQGIGTEMRAAVLHLAFGAWARRMPSPPPSRTTPLRMPFPASSATSRTASSGWWSTGRWSSTSDYASPRRTGSGAAPCRSRSRVSTAACRRSGRYPRGSGAALSTAVARVRNSSSVPLPVIIRVTPSTSVAHARSSRRPG